MFVGKHNERVSQGRCEDDVKSEGWNCGMRYVPCLIGFAIVAEEVRDGWRKAEEDGKYGHKGGRNDIGPGRDGNGFVSVGGKYGFTGHDVETDAEGVEEEGEVTGDFAEFGFVGGAALFGRGGGAAGNDHVGTSTKGKEDAGHADASEGFPTQNDTERGRDNGCRWLPNTGRHRSGQLDAYDVKGLTAKDTQPRKHHPGKILPRSRQNPSSMQ